MDVFVVGLCGLIPVVAFNFEVQLGKHMKQLWAGTKSSCSMCKGVECTKHSRKVVEVVTMNVLVCVGKFPVDCFE